MSPPDPDSTPSPVALGVDVGGTRTKAGLVDRAGRVSAFTAFPTQGHGSAGPFMEDLRRCIRDLLALAPSEVVGIGLSVHGWTDDDRKGPILCFNTPALHGVDMKTPLEQELDRPVVVNNDLTAHALAEYAYGVGQGVGRFLCLALGTGLGAGVVVKGKPLRHVGGCAGDTGHVILEPGGPRCSAGCRGCAEALAGVEGIERLAREAYGRPVAARDVIAAAREGGDERAAQVMRQIGRYVGETLATLSVIYLPDRMAITGGTAEAGPVLMDAAKARFEELVGEYHRTFAGMPGEYYSGTDIVFGRTRGETGVVGSVVELLADHGEKAGR